MNGIDFEIYKSIQQEKKLTEIYVGSTSISWYFAIADYTANCTEAIPFTPFDRVICGLLSIDNVLSFEEIAAILGFNVIDNPANNQYKDIAEHEILTETLSSLYDYGMIEKGDSYFSRCCLTKIGREYAMQLKKFKTTENKEFQLYFDLTINNHEKAKEIFQDIKANKLYSADTNIDFKNESFLKSFAEFQIPDIYSVEKSNSFANTQLENVSFFSVELQAGIIYDFQLNTFRIKIYGNQTKNDYFTDNANAIEALKTTIIQSFFGLLQPANSTKSEVQQQFEEKTCETQSDADYLLFQNKPQEAVGKINQYYKETDIIEIPNFWQNPEIWVDNEIGEIFLYFTELQDVQLNAVAKLTKTQPKIIIYLAFNSANCDVSKLPTNVYWCDNMQIKQFSCFSKDWFIYDFAFLVPFIENLYCINLITKNIQDCSNDIIFWKKHFSKKYIPVLLQEFQLFLQSDFEISLHNIKAVQNADNKVIYFENWFSNFGFDTQYSVLKQQKLELVEQLKQQHRSILLEKINALLSDTDIDSIEKLDQINDIKVEIKTIENEDITEYTEVLEKIGKLKTELVEKESYIKDQLLAKHYIIDTNVFVDCPEILSKIDIKHNVVLSAKVIDELDKLKRKLKGTEKENVDKALKLINQKFGKKKGNLRTARADLRLLPVDFNDKSPDNLILCVALMYKDKNPFLLTSDNGLQAKAKICDIPTISLIEFLYGKVKLPINTQTGVMIDRQILIDAYNSTIKKKKSVTFSEFNSALNNAIKGFSYKQYGFPKFKDFCNSLSEIFKIQIDDKGVECLTLK
jgi:rRNA-processing protein FCF1